MLITVTGSAGRLGREVVRELLEHGFAVRSVDRAVGPSSPGSASAVTTEEFVSRDLGSLAQAHEAVRGADAVVHLAAIPDLEGEPGETVLANNVGAAFNVARAAAEQGIGRLVYVSSQCATGTPYSPFLQHLAYLPVDESYPGMPIDPYGLSKYLSECACEQLSRAYGMTVASLRYPVIWFEPLFEQAVRARLDDPQQGAKSLWSYVDARDAATAVRLALTADLAGHEVFNITGPTAFVSGDVLESVSAWYGEVELRAPLHGNPSLLDTSKAERLLGFIARYQWNQWGVRDTLSATEVDVEHQTAGENG